MRYTNFITITIKQNNMTAKDKAIELCGKFFKPSVFKYEEKQYLVDEELAKQSALICVDEMLSIYDAEGYDSEDYKVVYLEEVKQEIINYENN